MIFVTRVAPGGRGLLRTQAGAEDGGEADGLLQGWMLGIDQIGQK